MVDAVDMLGRQTPDGQSQQFAVIGQGEYNLSRCCPEFLAKLGVEVVTNDAGKRGIAAELVAVDDSARSRDAELTIALIGDSLDDEGSLPRNTAIRR